MAECACVPECDTAGSWCRVAPGVFISLKFGQSIGEDKPPSPIPKTQSLVFIMLIETDACLLREANQRKAEKACCNDEKQSGAEGTGTGTTKADDGLGPTSTLIGPGVGVLFGFSPMY